MDRSSLHTSVVIEVANQEEPDDQKTYQIDFDDLEIPKDYIIDQVFCGENITVYALLEVPEDGNVSSNDYILDVPNPKANDGYGYFQKNSSKNIKNHRKLNGVKQGQLNTDESTMNILQNNDNKNGSFYCLKHISGDYEMLTPERENSELKILYSKSTVSRNSKPTKFKAVSKGVNTDIVQSPKIIHEVQKAVKQNIPFSKTEGKPSGVTSISSSKPSYEVIEMEMRQSFSSLSSYGDSRKQGKKSVPNFFLVPLLMMEDGVLSHFQSDNKIQKIVDDEERKSVVPETVSMGTNTDMLTPSLSEEKKNEIILDVSLSETSKSGNDAQRKQLSSSSNGKISSKNSILSEIKKLQGKLNSLIKSIESDSLELDTSEQDSTPEEPPAPRNLEPETLLGELKPLKTNWKKHDDLPILSTLTYPPCKTGRKKQGETPREVRKEEILLMPTKSNSIGFISCGESSKSQITRTQSASNYGEYNSKERMKTLSRNCSIIWSELDNRRGAGLSKSTTNWLNPVDPKWNFVNGIRKSLSFDLRDVKFEVACLKKIKNKTETKQNMRILQKREAIMGDEACNKPKTSKIDLLSLSKPTVKADDLKLEKKNLDSRKILKEEDGDAKLVYPKENLINQIITHKMENIEVHFCNTIIPDKTLLPTPVKSKGACNVVEVEPKICSDSDGLIKPTTPNKTSRRPTPPNAGAKREPKTLKKMNYQPNKVKLADKIPRPEAKEANQHEGMKQRSVTGSRKFTLKGTAEGKLHVDRLIKLDNPNGSKGCSEKTGAKTSRLPCQKRESPDPPEEAKEKTEKTQKTNSVPATSRKDNESSGLEKTGETDSIEEPCDNSPDIVPSKSGVVVELFSEKPSEKLYPEDGTNLIKTPDGEAMFDEKGKPAMEVSDDSLDPAKPVVKSVWALTKVLLFEDGSKKIEILEASLTPPGYSLPQSQPDL